MQNELIAALPTESLRAMREQFKDSPNVLKLLDAALGEREEEEKQAKLQLDFQASLAKIKLETPPKGISNVYFGWAEVEDKTKPETVEVVKTQAVTDKDGKIVTPAVTESVVRFPKVWQWVPEVNKGFKTPNAPTTEAGKTEEAKTVKRAITVFKRNGTQLENMGNFRSGSKACEYLKLALNGDSATRVLASNGYITEAYTGTDFKA